VKIVELNLSQIKVYENNPRNNFNAVPKVKESIKKYGYKVPMVVDREYVLVAGHTRYHALNEIEQERGYNVKYHCIFADDLTDEQVAEFRIVDNLVAEQAEWDITKLKTELEFLPDLDLNLFGEIPALTIEDLQLQEEARIDLADDNIKFKIGTDQFEMTEMEYHSWVTYVIGTYNMTVIDWVKKQLHIALADREFEQVEI
jgi:ParB family transcriptional regulator, chromosome partitioning protein